MWFKLLGEMNFRNSPLDIWDRKQTIYLFSLSSYFFITIFMFVWIYIQYLILFYFPLSAPNQSSDYYNQLMELIEFPWTYFAIV